MKLLVKIGVLLFVIIVIAACEFDYRIPRGSRISNRVYIADRIVNIKSGISTPFIDTQKQMLIFSGDTMRVVRNDTVIEQLVQYRTAGILGKEKEGKTLLEGFSKEGLKTVLIQLLEPKNAISGDAILSPFMSRSYQETADTIKTYYKSYP